MTTKRKATPKQLEALKKARAKRIENLKAKGKTSTRKSTRKSTAKKTSTATKKAVRSAISRAKKNIRKANSKTATRLRKATQKRTTATLNRTLKSLRKKGLAGVKKKPLSKRKLETLKQLFYEHYNHDVYYPDLFAMIPQTKLKKWFLEKFKSDFSEKTLNKWNDLLPYNA